ncbi:L-fucose kinase [Lamellibrachia satsuma]|nr:L-fucose kinase [Lamellibrachia satsuma]
MTELQAEMEGYDQQEITRAGALLKAAFCCAGIVTFPSCTASLSQQLAEKYGGGFELHTWSFLPHGSGLGTSSILAGAVIAVLWTASGRKYDMSSLNHAVLNLEQMLTTGGGWQDQVGGLAPGVKISHSKPCLPLHIEVTFPSISEETLRAFNDRLLLVYTGKTRLAKNLLQNVIRNWYARDPTIVTTEDNLVNNAWQCARAFEEGNLVGVGRCMDTYWQQKKMMAPGCEPQVVAQMMSVLRDHTLGCVMAGAGGGGFVYILMKEPYMEDVVRELILSLQGSETMTVHKACVDSTGMTLTVEGEGRVHVN